MATPKKASKKAAKKSPNRVRITETVYKDGKKTVTSGPTNFPNTGSSAPKKKAVKKAPTKGKLNITADKLIPPTKPKKRKPGTKPPLIKPIPTKKKKKRLND